MHHMVEWETLKYEKLYTQRSLEMESYLQMLKMALVS